MYSAWFNVSAYGIVLATCLYHMFVDYFLTDREVTTRPVPASITFIPVADGGSNSYEIKINLQAGNNILQPDRTFFVELTTNNCSTFQSTNSTVPCNCPQTISCGCKIVLENAIVTIQDDDGRSLPIYSQHHTEFPCVTVYVCVCALRL